MRICKYEDCFYYLRLTVSFALSFMWVFSTFFLLWGEHIWQYEWVSEMGKMCSLYGHYQIFTLNISERDQYGFRQLLFQVMKGYVSTAVALSKHQKHFYCRAFVVVTDETAKCTRHVKVFPTCVNMRRPPPSTTSIFARFNASIRTGSKEDKPH